MPERRRSAEVNAPAEPDGPGAASGDVAAELARMMAAGAEKLRAHGPETVALWDLAAAKLSGGKLIRPRLLLDAYEALAPDGAAPAPRSEAVRLAAALEMLHFAFLLHDDVIDGDLTRRGTDNLIGALCHRTAGDDPERSLHWARSAGILIGDLMLMLAHQAVARVPLANDRRTAVLDLLDTAVHETVAGEFLDVSLGDGMLAADPPAVLRMTGSKTAAYSVELPLRWAAVLAGTDPRSERTLAHVSRHLGLAYQLQDDTLSVFGDARRHGKDPFSDLREGKQTAIIAFARTTDAWEGIREHLGRPDLTQQRALALRALLVDCGARRHVERLTAAEMEAARQILTAERGALPGSVAEVLFRLVDRLDDRAA